MFIFIFMNLSTDRRYLYKFISSVNEIHLGMGDKMLIDKLMREHNLTTMDDIGGVITNHLIQFGYGSESRHLRETGEHRAVWLKDFAEYVSRRYEPNNL